MRRVARLGPAKPDRRRGRACELRLERVIVQQMKRERAVRDDAPIAAERAAETRHRVRGNERDARALLVRPLDVEQGPYSEWIQTFRESSRRPQRQDYRQQSDTG